MNYVTIIQTIGTVAFFLLFCLKFYIVIVDGAWHRAGRVAMLWTTIYIFFLFFLRVLQLLHIGTLDDLKIASSVAVFIPLAATIIQLFFLRKMHDVEIHG